MRLKELDRAKQQGIKFSKAFAEFTVLVYHNVFGESGSKSQNGAGKKTTFQTKPGRQSTSLPA